MKSFCKKKNKIHKNWEKNVEILNETLANDKTGNNIHIKLDS